MPQSQKGFALIPIIIGSVVILLIGIIGAVGLKPGSQKPLQIDSKETPYLVDKQSNTSPTPISQTKELQTKVITVIDGDIIKVSIDNRNEVVRLIGINSPETVDPRKPVECFGKEASAKATSLLLGKSVQLETDPTQGDKDKYQRLLRYVFLEDGTNFNKLMISEGYAHEYTYNTPYKYQSEFKQAQKEAETGKLGLWADNTCSTSTTQHLPTKLQQEAPQALQGLPMAVVVLLVQVKPYVVK